MRITSKGQVTIPQNIRELAGLTPGMEVDFEYCNGQIMLVRVADRENRTVRARRLIERLRGSATANLDLSTDEWMRLTRGED